MEGSAEQQYIISEFIEESNKLIIVRIDSYMLNMLDFGDISKFGQSSKLVLKNIT